MTPGSAEKKLPKEAREEVDHLIDYLKDRIGQGADEAVLAAATTAVARAFADSLMRPN